MNCNI
jgi:hypothetical protein